MAKISDKKKVELLEQAVLNNNGKEVASLFKEHKKFEFTARALGYACRYSDLEVVKLLIKNKVSFKFIYDSTLQSKYGVAHKTAGGIYPAQYYLMLLDDKHDPRKEYHLGHLPTIKLKCNCVEKRIEILDYLLEEKCGFNVGKLLYYAILWGDKGVAKHLINKGYFPDEEIMKVLSDSNRVFFKQEFVETIATHPVTILEFVFQELSAFLTSKLVITASMFEGMKDRMVNSKLLKNLMENTDLSRVNKEDILRMAILSEDSQILESVLQKNNITDYLKINKYIDIAMDKGCRINLAFLLEYKSRYTNLEDEMNIEAKKMEQELMSNPNSATNLKKIWSFETQKDGSVKITSYKGTDLEVVIPEYIGKSPVTAIERTTFAISTTQGRITEKQKKARMQIVSIEFPGTIKEIPDKMFSTSYDAKYDKLKRIILHKGVNIVGESAFEGLINVEEMVLPEAVKEIKASAFKDCSNLKRVDLPEGLSYICSNAFAGCEKLTKITLPDTVIELSNGLFSGSGIEEFEFPRKIEKVGNGVFSRCFSLKSIQWPHNIDEIPNSSFSGSGLCNIILTGDIKHIGDWAFSNCSNLEKFEIDKEVIIGMEAFSGCDQFKDKDGLVVVNNQFFGVDNKYDRACITLPDTIVEIKLGVRNLPRFIHFDNQIEDKGIENKVHVGDELELGRFIFTEDLKLSPIKWKVIAIENNKALCITKYALFSNVRNWDAHWEYRWAQNLDIYWKNSQVRKFLNGKFMKTFFSTSEQNVILVSNNSNIQDSDYKTIQGENTEDKLFLLSIEEILKYMPCTQERIATITEYIRCWEPVMKYQEQHQWLTRNVRKDLRTVAVDERGNLNLTSGVIRSVIRPAMWIDLDKIKELHYET